MRSKKYIQIEVTRDCSENCLVCPHRKYKFSGKMNFNDFLSLSRKFSDFEIVYLQGWGEPLNHDRFFDMLEVARRRAKTGFTTNGRKLRKYSNKVAELTDYLLVSFGGVESHNVIRGVNFDRVLDGMRAVSEIKFETDCKIRVGASYMLTTENWSECVDFVRIVADIADYVVFTNLDYTFDEITEKLRLFEKPESSKASKVVEEALTLARKLGMNAKAYPLKLEEQAVCEANPHISVAVSCDCELYPCIYMCLPFDRIERVFFGKKVEVPKPNFGKFQDLKAWKRYEEFANIFRKRISAYNKAIDLLMYSSPFTAIRKLSEIDNVLAANPPPIFCRTCYKLYGV